MEANRPRLGGVFPGYNGPALRRAMRSSRGRAKSFLQAPKCEKGTGFFELLAAVAGQLLQDASKGDELPRDKSERDIPIVQGCPNSKESVEASNFEAAQALEKRTIGALPILCSSHVLPLVASEKIGEASSLKHMLDGTQIGSVISKPVAVKPSQRQVTVSAMGLDGKHQNGIIHTLQKGCTPEWEGHGKHHQTLPISEEEGLGAKSDNESGTASTESKEKFTLQRQAGARHHTSFNPEKPEPCGINQVAHEYSPKDTKEPDFRMLSEDVLSNEMLEQEDFEEECSALNGTQCEHSKDCEEVLTQASEEPDSQKKLLHVGQEGEYFGKIPGSMDLMFSSKEGNVCSRQIQLIKTQSKNIIPNEDKILGNLIHSLRSEEMQRHIKLDRKSLGSYSSEQECTLNYKGEKSEETLSECVMPELGAKMSVKRGKSGNDTAQWPRGLKHCSKRKHLEMESMVDTGGKYEEQLLYIESTYTRQRSRRVYKYSRKRVGGGEDRATKLFMHPNDTQGTNCQCEDGEPPASAAKLRRAKAVSVASPTRKEALCKISNTKPTEPHVKVSIKSFTVPELSINLPESATVANLKKAVMDAAMNVLGGGLKVRVLLQGKKVSDENASLLQLGISRSGKAESLGFMLEPNPMPTCLNPDDPLLLLSHAASQPSPRSAALQHDGEKRRLLSNTGSKSKGDSEVTVTENILPDNGNILPEPELSGEKTGASDASLKVCEDTAVQINANTEAPLSGHCPQVATMGAMVGMIGQTNIISWPRHDSDSTSSLSEVTPLPGHSVGPIILHPGIARESAQGMSLVPINPNSQLEVGKRRIRRPFSVGEVEALVMAVEKLGTGRWRDVKVSAFDQAKHRTYVDLKDKWKTLVHTAQIAPHQRRGEPVPEDLLQRVLQANTYWAAQQARQQIELDC